MGPGPVPIFLLLLGAWPTYGGALLDAYDSLDPSTWWVPTAPYPLSQQNINVENQFIPRLGQANYNNRRRAQWLVMTQAHDQLRQRMAKESTRSRVLRTTSRTISKSIALRWRDSGSRL